MRVGQSVFSPLSIQANDINLIDTAGMSALHLACIKGTPAIVYYLSSFPRYTKQRCEVIRNNLTGVM